MNLRIGTRRTKMYRVSGFIANREAIILVVLVLFGLIDERFWHIGTSENRSKSSIVVLRSKRQRYQGTATIPNNHYSQVQGDRYIS